ncbi:MAG: lytic transglycosylase [Pseudomonadota bacterium]
MYGKIGLILLCSVLIGCGGGGSTKAPRNLDNACSILKQRPAFKKAFNRTERRWGVPVAVQMATIYQESKFISNARTPMQYALGVIPMGRQSSAYGYSQALDGTWDDYRKDRGRWGAKRNDIDDAADFMGWYMTQSVAKNGIPLNDARNQYLAYHEGHTGYARGSYRSKAWLGRVASEVGNRAVMYNVQLQDCR